MLGLSIDQANTSVVQKYVEELNLTFTQLHDQKGDILKKFAEQKIPLSRGVPTSYFINAAGEAVGMVVGPRPWDGKDVENLIEHLLAEAQ